ncbi:MAG: M23 family metallopeptidase [Proteobacteria bacterium]|nr:M23 family metallopeptidase [Pseudomonadota bacterium]
MVLDKSDVENGANHAGSLQQGAFRLLVALVALVVVAALLLVAFKGWKVVYERYFERTPPRITFEQQQLRGVGISPVVMNFNVADAETGLDEVVVRVRQRSGAREILRRSLKGARSADISLDVPGEKSSLEEGPLRLEIKVFDRSLWSNSAEQAVDTVVDFRKPRLEPVTVMHNARRGGSQLVFFKASDPNLAFAGVKVGNQTFLGFPARQIDPAFQDPTLYAALYAIDIRSNTAAPSIRLFAQDTVGNAASAGFPNRVLPRPDRTQVIPISDEFLAEQVATLAQDNLERIRSFAAEMGRSAEGAPSQGTSVGLLESFHLVNDLLRVYSEQKLSGLLKRAGKGIPHWTGPFDQQGGSINSSFGDTLSFKYAGQVIAATRQVGFDILMPKGASINSAADGIVIFSENIGTYGNVVGIDHGMGLVSVYGRLRVVGVNPGTVVKAGQTIGVSGSSGFARGNQVYFELRVQGVPVDPREWWDKDWFNGHITDQITTAKKLLEIPLR